MNHLKHRVCVKMFLIVNYDNYLCIKRTIFPDVSTGRLEMHIIKNNLFSGLMLHYIRYKMTEYKLYLSVKLICFTSLQGNIYWSVYLSYLPNLSARAGYDTMSFF